MEWWRVVESLSCDMLVSVVYARGSRGGRGRSDVVSAVLVKLYLEVGQYVVLKAVLP